MGFFVVIVTFLFYSYVHTLFGSFLPPSLDPFLNHTTPFLFPASQNWGRNAQQVFLMEGMGRIEDGGNGPPQVHACPVQSLFSCVVLQLQLFLQLFPQ
jgi:hypothetical protein